MRSLVHYYYLWKIKTSEINLMQRLESEHLNENEGENSDSFAEEFIPANEKVRITITQ